MLLTKFKFAISYEKSGEKWWKVEENFVTLHTKRHIIKKTAWFCKTEQSNQPDITMRFLGNIDAKADQKGRVFLPSVFRKELQAGGDDSLVLRKDVFQRCLVLYPTEVWNAMMDEMRSKLSRWDAHEQQVYRQFVSDAEIVSLDGNGRFLISRRAQEFAGIATEVSFIGMGDTIEIWAKEKTEQPFMSQEDFGSALADLMQNNDK